MRYLIFILAVMIISCSVEKERIEVVDGVKIFNNSNFAAEDPVKVETEFLYTVNEFIDDTSEVVRSITAFTSDSRSNIYILDRREDKIFKFNDKGKFIKSFGQSGNGPGEMRRPVEMFNIHDTLYVSERRGGKLILFTTEGDHVRDRILSRKNGVPQNIMVMSDTLFIAVMLDMKRGDKGKRTLEYKLSLLDEDFKVKSDLLSKELEFEFRNFYLEEHINKFTVSDSLIYIAENTDSRYRINVYNRDGEKISEIRKSYARTRYLDAEREQLQEMFNKSWRTREIDAEDYMYKKAITGLFYHDDGYLLVESSRTRENGMINDLIIDVFKDGIYIDTINLNRISNPVNSFSVRYNKRVINRKLFLYSDDENIIYAYKLKIKE